MKHSKVCLHDGKIIITPEFPEALKKALTYWHRRLEVDERTRTRVVAGSYKQLYDYTLTVDCNNRPIHTLTTLPGFVSRITRIMDDAGYTYEILDNRTRLPEPDIAAALAGLRTYQEEAAYNAVMSGGGLICAPTAFGKTHLIAAILRAFTPEQLTYRNTPLSVVVAADADVCRKNYNDLVGIFKKTSRDIGLVMTGSKQFSDDIQVITFDSLHYIKPEDIGILIVDEVHMASTDRRVEYLLSARKAMRWGLSATPTGRFDGADLVAEGVFGPIVYKSTYAEGIASGGLVPIEVCWLPCPEPGIGLDKYFNYKRRISKYDYGVERNKNLNAMVMSLINSIPDTMQTLCIMPHLQQMNELCGIDNTVKIVHAATSQDTLSKSRYHSLVPINKKEREQIYTDMASGKIRKILSTYVYKQGVNFPQLTVVICPGGGGSEIVAGQIPGRASRNIEGKDKAYIVDFEHPWDIRTVDGKPLLGPLAKDDKSRARVYKSLGFTQTHYTTITELPFVTTK